MNTSFGPGIRKRTGIASVLAVSLLVLAGCTSVPVAPPTSLTAAKDAIASAEQADARQYAAAELDEANRKMVQAEQAVAAEHLAEAEYLAQESHVAAKLAMARTEAAKATDINKQLVRDAGALTEELNRTGNQR